MKYLAALLLLCKPTIILSVGLTGFTGMILASRSFPEPNLVILTILSLVLSAGGAAIINNIIEREKDQLREWFIEHELEVTDLGDAFKVGGDHLRSVSYTHLTLPTSDLV